MSFCPVISSKFLTHCWHEEVGDFNASSSILFISVSSMSPRFVPSSFCCTFASFLAFRFKFKISMSFLPVMVNIMMTKRNIKMIATYAKFTKYARNSHIKQSLLLLLLFSCSPLPVWLWIVFQSTGIVIMSSLFIESCSVVDSSVGSSLVASVDVSYSCVVFVVFFSSFMVFKSCFY